MPKLYKLEYGDLFQNEARALSHAHIFGVPRVIKYIEGARTTDDICLILEYVWLALQKLCSLHNWPVPTCTGHKVLLSCRLVRGKTLSTHMCSRPAHAQPGWEQQTLGVAVQLLDVSGLIAHIVCCTFAAVMMNSHLLLNVQTLEHLHMKANVCHLDLTITNVMLQDDRSNGWDVLRLIDFGFAQVFNEGNLVSPQSMLQGFRSKHLPALFLLLLQQCRPMSLQTKSIMAMHCIAQQHISKCN